MIPSTNNKLLVSEDWKKIYQSFRNADFQSYDFETLRRVMVAYLQENYPEDFNDYIDSSEFIALIDLIAYLGQNLSFRVDLNARENFLETAQRRDSILRLAQLVSYIPHRNLAANGFLKILSVSTTDSVIDGNGINLANSNIGWNDSTNTNWYQQFITVLNSAMPGSSLFGKPFDRKTIDSVLTEQYRINSSNTDVPIFSFNKNINGTTMNFEVVPATFSEKAFIYEEPPRPGSTFSFIYKNDNQGYASINTGFFAHFRQGQIGTASFTIDNPVSNEIVGINTPDINNTDTWLWQLDGQGFYSTLWTRVPDIVGNNVIYNSLSKNERNIYSITTRDRDQIDLNFADGSFGNLPKGSFRLLYRQSNGLTFSIKPDQISGVVVEIPYFNKAGQSHVLTLVMSLQYTVSNSLGAETNASIQSKAPQAYYTQNRMVTAEDYNIAPLTLGSDVVKTKSVARVTSGLSKYFELSDVSGKYSNTNIFATDGILYKQSSELSFSFESSNRNEIFSIIKQRLEPVLTSPSFRSFYLDNYQRPALEGTWIAPVTGQARGYFTQSGYPITVGGFSSSNFKYVTPGSMIKFIPPTGKFFTPAGKIVNTASSKTLKYLWAQVVQVVADGSNAGIGPLDDGTGPIILNRIIPSTAVPVEVIPKFVNVYSYEFENELVNLCLRQRNFGLTVNKSSRQWEIILDTNLDLFSPFSLSHQSNTENLNKDASWLIAFSFTGKGYLVRYRLTDFIFESQKETAFFADPDSVNYDFTNNKVVKDKITVLSINPDPSIPATGLGNDYQWQIDSSVVEADGYIDPKKVLISFYDDNNTGNYQDPDAFTNIVDPSNFNYVYFQKSNDGLRYTLIEPELFTVAANPDSVVSTPQDGDLYYFYDTDFNIVKRYSSTTSDPSDPWIYEPSYSAYLGRSNLKFHYVHNSSQNRRIDPSKSNIIDVYLLTREYDTAYRSWLSNGTGQEPLAPTTASLEQNYSAALEPIKTISDEIIFQPVKYKALFGSQAPVNLQATFKAVKNSSRPISDNELKSRILNAIQDFFSLDNWDFGQTFYFSELATYVMNIMTPDITNFVIVPKTSNSFGSLYEISCLSNELLISGATADEIEIIDALSAVQLKSNNIVTTSES